MESKLHVKLLRFTPEPEEVVAMAAKLCYSSSTIDDLIEKIEAKDQCVFVEKLASIGHLSPVEHVSFTFGIEGISRACSHQLVRHRIGASYSQVSQRHIKPDQFSYVIPPSIAGVPELKQEFENLMAKVQEDYDRFFAKLEDLGYKGEAAKQDARYLLPNATETKFVLTMNARELLHFFRVRCCNRAQWEIRAMAEEMLHLVRGIAPTIFAKAGPGCLSGVCSEGSMSCCQVLEVRAKYGVDAAGKIKRREL